MAQKMAPGRARKANKKPATRKAAHHPTAPARAAKPKVKGAPPKAQAKQPQAKPQAKHVRKPAPVKPQKQVATAVKPASTKRPIESQTVQAKEATKSGVPAN